ncbi:IclR family transcriptional regulator [Actinomadura madurae]|uniref:Transcriptional regulator, IclR family n=2 Tax=Actinomadura madurae TaxID=1993 RepID=A0A1I5X845_9ACTN|nr:IclR family transcriptional regulator [Actinomadura madurae]MCP9953540.1 IclR family transcriptional regulator [Actinomadura madurae]MCP9970296.1 IclR family transcriptional regulator [Actinomadura madurae]MCP9982774.1 IclR family transcriptional regulator [Actinomadura madurae]MCQ0005678.1 IclR family transcriptional regulator [Actinomadura madurae]MCQ0019010.1 IclR family transcriptional regulator [Actinomadura madurae]
MRSVKTAFQVLDAVADHQPVGLSELARRLGLPKATAQRSLAVLAEVGWIKQDGQDITRWVLSDRARIVAQRVGDHARLRDAALPSLARLHADTLETIHLTVPDDQDVVLVERLDSPHPVRAVRPIGTRLPLHASSTGKVILAHMPEEEIRTYLAQNLSSPARHTKTDPEALLVELKRVRECGYAVAEEEAADGIASVAGAIRPDGQRAVAAMSISGPVSRIRPDIYQFYGEKVKAAAETVSRELASW